MLIFFHVLQMYSVVRRMLQLMMLQLMSNVLTFGLVVSYNCNLKLFCPVALYDIQ